MDIINATDEPIQEIVNAKSDKMFDEKKFAPKEITKIFTCSKCRKNYATLRNLQLHISLVHRISLRNQRKSMQKGKSIAIITDT